MTDAYINKKIYLSIQHYSQISEIYKGHYLILKLNEIIKMHGSIKELFISWLYMY